MKDYSWTRAECADDAPDNSTVTTDGRYSSFFPSLVGVWLNGVICLVGVLGNAVSFLVLLNAFGSRSPMAYVLRSLSLADSGFLGVTFVVQTLVNIEWFQLFYQSRDIIQKYGWPLLMTFQMTSVWLTVLVSWERYVAVCKPLQTSSMCAKEKMRRMVVLILVSSILFNIPRLFEYTQEMEKSPVGSDTVYRYLYSAFLYSCLLFIMPLSLLCFLNVNLVLALNESRKSWVGLKKNQSQEQKAAKISLAIVAMFFLCGTPSLVINIVDSVDPELLLESEDDPVVVSLLVSNFLLLFNSASNIFIYFMFGKKFTRELQRTANRICCRKPRNYSESLKL